jgi:hypothetical protein
VPAGELDEHIFKTCLSCCEVRELKSLVVNGLQQCRDGLVRLVHAKHDSSVFRIRSLNARQRLPSVDSASVRARFKFDHVVSGESLDQFFRRSFSDDLAVIDDS